MNETIQAIKTRRAIRKYTDQQISDEQLNELTACVLASPSARNARPYHVSFVQNAALLGEFNAAVIDTLKAGGRQMPDGYSIFYHAPTVALISYDPNEMWGAIDTGIVSQTLCIAAKSMGLGSIDIGMFRMYTDKDSYDVSFNEKLKVPENYKLALAVAIGYAADDPAAPAVKENYSVIK